MSALQKLIKENARRTSKKLGYIIGIRKHYKIEVFLTLLGVFSFITSYIILGLWNVLTIAIPGVILASVPVLQYYNYWRRVRNTPPEHRIKVPSPSVPLLTVLVSAALSGFAPPLVTVAILNALFIEDFTAFLSYIDIARFRRESVVLLEPLRRRETLVILSGVTVPTLVVFIYTLNPLVLIYLFISYAMVVYSLIVVPPEARGELERVRKSLIEELARRIPILYYIFRSIYTKHSMIRLGKEAGLIGASYYEFVRKSAGVFAFSIYVSLALSPLVMLLLRPLGLDFLGLLLPALAAGVTLFTPQLILRSKRSSRASKIRKNLVLILSYLASISSVAEQFTAAMENLRFNPNLANMFGLEKEANIYLGIYRTYNDESVAMDEYADSLPEEFYRDTLRTMKDIVENEGYGAVFRSLIARLRDFTLRSIDRVTALFQNIGGNVIAVIILVETTLPVLIFLSFPQAMPIFLILAGIMSTFMILAVAQMALPDLPSEYIHSKQRFRRSAVVFSLSSTVLLLVEMYLLPNLLLYLIFLNIVPCFFLALYYASAEDLAINKSFLEKFPDLLTLFGSVMLRHNNVERSLLELSTISTFPLIMRRQFEKLVNIFSVITIEKIVYRGPYWYKFFVFLASIATKYGTTPRDLYRVVSEFMLEYKKFFASVANFGFTVLFMSLMALVVLNLEVQIVTNFLQVFSQAGFTRQLGQLGISSPLPELSPQELENTKQLSRVALLVIATMNGVAIGKIMSGTFRDGRYAFLFYIIQIALIYIGITTNFGINIQPTR